ncbi:hypothetical protein [Beijerinckia sp. L45]|uniref:hypothetical protein n=1 Tax=Beijerinckia sp. L45 TaxID=1641855 RepID=UPI00131DBD59|nr:hypothetical protein [Beijerinckia sp. L45]
MANAPSLLRRLSRIPAEIVVGLYVTVDFLVAPLFRPLMRWLSSLRLIQRIEGWIASLPPYVLLVLLVVPFAIAELAKAYAVFLMGSGHFKTGITIFIGAYIVSILVCERTFTAGKAQLMTIGWFARLWTWLMSYKDRIMAWFRSTEVWRLAADLKQRARLTLRRIKTRLGMDVGTKPSGSFEQR